MIIDFLIAITLITISLIAVIKQKNQYHAILVTGYFVLSLLLYLSIETSGSNIAFLYVYAVLSSLTAMLCVSNPALMLSLTIISLFAGFTEMVQVFGVTWPLDNYTSIMIVLDGLMILCLIWGFRGHRRSRSDFHRSPNRLLDNALFTDSSN